MPAKSRDTDTSPTDNPNGTGKVLLIAGTTHMGVDAANVFIFNDARMAPIIARAPADKGPLANFEVLLETRFMNGDSANTEIVATRFYPHS